MVRKKNVSSYSGKSSISCHHHIPFPKTLHSTTWNTFKTNNKKIKEKWPQEQAENKTKRPFNKKKSINSALNFFWKYILLINFVSFLFLFSANFKEFFLIFCILFVIIIHGLYCCCTFMLVVKNKKSKIKIYSFFLHNFLFCCKFK